MGELNPPTAADYARESAGMAARSAVMGILMGGAAYAAARGAPSAGLAWRTANRAFDEAAGQVRDARTNPYATVSMEVMLRAIDRIISKGWSGGPEVTTRHRPDGALEATTADGAVVAAGTDHKAVMVAAMAYSVSRGGDGTVSSTGGGTFPLIGFGDGTVSFGDAWSGG